MLRLLSTRTLIARPTCRRRPGRFLALLYVSLATPLGFGSLATANPSENHTLSLMLTSFGYEPPAFILEEPARETEIASLGQPETVDPPPDSEPFDEGSPAEMSAEPSSEEGLPSGEAGEDSSTLSSLIDALGAPSLAPAPAPETTDTAAPPAATIEPALVPVDAAILSAVLGRPIEEIATTPVDETIAKVEAEPEDAQERVDALIQPTTVPTPLPAYAEVAGAGQIPLPSPRPADPSSGLVPVGSVPKGSIEVLSAEEALRRLEEGEDLFEVQTIPAEQAQELYDQLQSQSRSSSTRSSSN